ncbi:MAG: pyridoxamine 5'-phosphate oxidase family protein [Tannerella sp.]|nr:pyridoxamine 5'-phosphate oxidase family protein [Tannerella sp.]
MKTIIHTEQEKIESVIRQCSICHVGMADTDGIPYVLPMNFGYREGVVFLHSAQEGSHVDILHRNPHVCVVFTSENELVCQHPDVACSYRMRSETVIGWGKVVFEEDFDRKTEALDILMKQYSDRQFRYSEPAVVNTKIWRIELKKVTCRSFGVPHGQTDNSRTKQV